MLPLREQPPTNHHKEHTRRHQQKTVIPLIRQSILRLSRFSIPKSTRRMRIPVHSTLRIIHNLQTKQQTTEQHTLVQPPFSKNISTNIGHRFLALVDKHFPKDYKLRKSLVVTQARSVTAA